ncbi:hypothetical protein CYMTET_29519 [Cymbomonas tetramitiformis]|uniref:Mutator-like transposase domain-containing protein n=1 Tax=Cymbomonas tetramitiformis TaxID=36881 RepID=A0AAE0FKX0_9CHLO|nr:hypothetical protein CYMTET_29519 [Cymbomonas tetramitiformis]|eukprot:gene34357-biopygen26901
MEKDSGSGTATKEVNLLHAVGLQNAGLCPAKMEKYFTSLGVHYQLHRTNLGYLQRQVGKVIEGMAILSCAKALQHETLLAKDRGDAIDGVVQLGVTGDAAWPNRGSGRSYASFCGMFVLMGASMKKVISAAIFDKMCYVCELAERQDPPLVPPPHDCWRGARGINCQSDPSWRGSSKAIEAEGAMLCVKSVGEHTFHEPMVSDTLTGMNVRVALFAANEDSNMIAAINDEKGIVPAKLRPVGKLSDPNHLQKLLFKGLEALRAERKWGGLVLSKAVIEYFNKQYRYVIKSVAVIEDLPGFDTMEQKAEWLAGAVMNIVDHAFDIDPTHESCRRYRVPLPDGSFHCWCGVESAKPDWTIHLPKGKFLQRDSPAGYYEAIKGVFKKFATKEVLMKQMHDMDTNANESVNGMVVKRYLPCGKA